MKLICDGLDLSDAVLKVSKALSVKAANPVLEGIKITAMGDTLTLLATDTELTIEKKIKADVMMEGETVVVGKYFVDFAKKLEKEQVELSRLFDGGLQIKYADSESELQVYPAESFPKRRTHGFLPADERVGRRCGSGSSVCCLSGRSDENCLNELVLVSSNV